MAATTPPPPNRARTPPTPLHGPNFDGYEPYSPRRSSRVASQPKINYSTRHINLTPLANQSDKAATPVRAQKSRSNRIQNQNISPPSSPSSPIPQSTSKKRKADDQRYLSNGYLDTHHPPTADSDLETHGSPANHLSVTGLDPRSMLPTPAKTPRKRPLQSQSVISSTARVLFPNRPANVDDAMPTPRKGRGSRKNGGFSLQSFSEDVDNAVGSSKIEVYTDSKERVPSMDADDDNPFMSKNKGKGLKKKVSDSQKPKKRVDKRTAQMEEAARNDEGIIYVFRGKKIFRRYDDEGQSSESDDELDTLSDREVLRKAGDVNKARLLRSHVKPKLLFSVKSRQVEEMEIDEEDEEATTDIEEPLSPPGLDENGSDSEARDQIFPKPSTPFKQRLHPATPPSSRPVRNSRKGVVDAKIEEGSPSVKHGLMEVSPDVISPPRQTRQKKTSPFDAWQRVKQSSTSSRAPKREADPAEEGPTSKRTRSGTHANPSGV